MISWIQRTFQQHFRAVFGVLLAVTIISFIFTIGASPGIGRAGPKTVSQKFFGYDLTRQGANDRVFGDASLSVQVQVGFSAGLNLDNARLQEYALERTAAIALADQLKIPAPTPSEIASSVKGLRAFAGSDGQFDANRYAAFRDTLKTNPRISEGDIVRVLSDDMRISRVRLALSGPGYVLPSEVRDQLARADASWTISTASIDYASFKPDIPVPADALQRFYNENAFRYVAPVRVGVDYLDFPASAYAGSVNLTDAEVRAFFDDNPARFPKPPEKKPEGDKAAPKPAVTSAANPDADFAAVRPQVEQALRTERTMRLAAKTAADLTVAIYEGRLKPQDPEFAAFLAGRHLTLKSVAPFDQDSVPPELGWTPQVVEQALQLTAERPVSDALTSTAGSLVVLWRQTVPSAQQEFALVRGRVTDDYKESELRRRFVELGRTIHTQLETRIKAGASLAQAVAGLPADQPKLDVKDFPSFLRRQPPKDIPSTVFSALERMGQGQVSDMMVAEGKGLFVYVKEKKLPDLTPGNSQYANTQAQLAQLTGQLNQQQYLSELVAREMKKTQPSAVPNK